ncbi:hypothetical protein ACQUQU_07725 [Thalassolituus sp. LLYu03]|uniref:hypothetical protein n=1 Tax=Thalassolituus sp. LLYu03 TaxID=3421656 RepID=UPI003D2CE5C0
MRLHTLARAAVALGFTAIVIYSVQRDTLVQIAPAPAPAKPPLPGLSAPPPPPPAPQTLNLQNQGRYTTQNRHEHEPDPLPPELAADIENRRVPASTLTLHPTASGYALPTQGQYGTVVMAYIGEDGKLHQAERQVMPIPDAVMALPPPPPPAANADQQ